MVSSVSGKKVLVVGGTGGIGFGIAQSLKDRGAEAILVGRHSVPGFDCRKIDLSDSAEWRKVLNLAEQTDILCASWGPFLQKPLHETSPEEWLNVVSSNLSLPGALVSAALPYMLSRGWGRILLFGGTRTDTSRGARTNAAYAAAKAGITSLVRSVALSYAAEGIQCNGICPGLVRTEYLDAEQIRSLGSKNPDGKLVEVSEIADAALMLMENSVYNGILLPVDKGWAPGLI